MASEYYKFVGEYYDTDSGDFDSRYWENPILQKIRQDFREHTKLLKFNSALEIGCGTGLDMAHFCSIFPEKTFFGMDLSSSMVDISNSRLEKDKIKNGKVYLGGADDIKKVFPKKKFDLIYVYFGALNTVEDLKKTADIIYDSLDTDGHLVLSFVNKHYFFEVFYNLIQLKLKKAFQRYKRVWGGYSPTKFLPSKCYGAKTIRDAFKTKGIETFRKGYSIIYPAWYRSGWIERMGRFASLPWQIDQILNKTPLWKFGEYTFFIYKKN